MRRKSPRQYAEILYEVTQDISGKLIDQAATAFVTLLAKDHSIAQANSIIDAFIKLTKEQSGVKELSVTSARELSENELQKIAGAFGKAVEVNTILDPALIGGISIRTGDTVLDGSLKTQLERLHKELTV